MRGKILAIEARANLNDECTRLDRVWESFVRGGHEGAKARPLILQSWYRCLDHRLDPLHNRTATPLSEAQVHEALETNPLMAEVQPVLASLAESAFDSEHMLVFCDEHGHIVSMDGEAWLRRRAESMNFIVGSIWNENKAGTNAIGTAIATGTPVQVFASEHYCHEVQPWTCSASPILDPATHRVLGVINLTGLREVFHPHTLSVVIAATQLIEQRLQRRLDLDRFLLLEQYICETSRRPNVALAVLDRGLRVVRASPALCEHGWIDGDRLVGCPLGTLTAPIESTWDAKQPRTNTDWSFAAASYLDHGRPVGVVVYVVKDGSSSLSPSHSGYHSRRTANGRNVSHKDIRHTFGTLIGQANSFRKAIAVASSAGSELPVLIMGETGTGKELVAQAIHSASVRQAGPFVAVNCAALPKELATTEFFGFEGGSFTGAARDGRIGKFEQAHRGTMFLDEIGDMPLDLQGLLLRVLEEREVVHVGGRKAISVDSRVIAASNQDLATAIEQGSFRRDLYYRLNVIRIELPPLRDRREDVALLLDYFLDRACENAGRRIRIDPAAMLVLQNHSWPGNIRELRNVAERLAVIGADVIRETDLPRELFRDQIGPQVTPDTSCSSFTALKTQELKTQEMAIIRSILDQCTGNVAEAARILGINRCTIYRKLRRSPLSK